MLYLFGQLALSDSLFYHENPACNDQPAAEVATPSKKAEPSARPAAAAQRHRERLVPPAERTTASQHD